jgi:hypothetical protein
MELWKSIGWKIKVPRQNRRSIKVSGEGGIRTRGRGFCPDNRLAGGPNQPLWHLPYKAEGEGFEPPVGFNTHSCFQDSRLSPLGHPSIRGGYPLPSGLILP